MKKIRGKGFFSDRWFFGIPKNIEPIIGELGKPIINLDTGLRVVNVVYSTVGEFVYTTSKGRDCYTGDVFFNEIEDDFGDIVLFSVLVWLPERLMYALLSLGEYMAYTKGQQPLDENEHYGVCTISDLEKLHYKGTIYDEGFEELSSGAV